MIARLILAALVGLAAAGSALALIPKADVPGPSGKETIIEKNQYWPVLGPVVIEPCATESCMEVRT